MESEQELRRLFSIAVLALALFAAFVVVEPPVTVFAYLLLGAGFLSLIYLVIGAWILLRKLTSKDKGASSL